MKTAILCGGYGTRIRDVSFDLPKPMIPIGDKPILWHIMRYYASWGCDRFVLALGYKGDAIRDYFLNFANRSVDATLRLGVDEKPLLHGAVEETGWEVTLAETGLDTMTGGRVRRLRRHLGDEPFMLTYGDGLSDIDIEALVRFHRSHGRAMTVTGVRPPARWGEIRYEADGTAIEFNEKPQATEGRISGGFFVCEPRIFDYLGDNDGCILEREPMQRIAADRQMMIFEHDGFWHPMDTHRDYLYLSGIWNAGEAPWMAGRKR